MGERMELTREERLLNLIFQRIAESPQDVLIYRDALSCIREIGNEKKKIQVAPAHYLQRLIKQSGVMNDNFYDLNLKVLCYCAPDCLDDYIIYMESDRTYEKQFYLPRRKQLKPLIDAMEQLERRELEILGISMPPGTGKTGSAGFFMSWVGGRHPEKPNIIGSHSNSFLRGLYGELLRLDAADGEYKFNDVFPNTHIISTNALDMMIDLGRDARDAKRFTTYQLSSIGSGNAGKIRAGNVLYCDDLVSDLEEAMSRERMDKKFASYSVDYRQRKEGDCVELHIATRWSVHDVIGRLERMYEGNPKARFIVCPALNENDESNFDYPIPQGFTTKFYHEQREAMDDASFKALYMNQPIEREGQLYPENELRRYYDLPGAEYDEKGNLISFDPPDAILSICDTKGKGTDYCFAPVGFQYGQDHYIEYMLCDNSSPDVVDARLIDMHVKYNVQMSRFESNVEGARIADKVQKGIKERGGRTKITTKYTRANKETKIIVNSAWVKEHCLFKADPKDKEYRRALSFLCSWNMTGKNKVDDVPDGMAQYAEFAQGISAGRVEVMKSPFRL